MGGVCGVDDQPARGTDAEAENGGVGASLDGTKL